MNISRASLFPGLDGFARSLGIMLELEMEREFTLDEPQISPKNCPDRQDAFQMLMLRSKAFRMSMVSIVPVSGMRYDFTHESSPRAEDSFALNSQQEYT